MKLARLHPGWLTLCLAAGAPACRSELPADAVAALDMTAATCVADTLSDPAHCGRCGHGCLGGGCDQGRCTARVLAAGQSEPFLIVADGRSLFWTNRGGGIGSVAACEAPDCHPRVIAGDQERPWGIAVDAHDVYWTTYAGCDRGAVMAAPRSGGPARVVAPRRCSPTGVSLTARALYFADQTLAGGIGAIGLPSGAVTEAVSDENGAPFTVVAFGDRLYWTERNGANAAMVFDTTTHESKAMATKQGDAGFIAADGAGVYWTAVADHRIMAASARGDGATPFAEEADALEDIAVDDEWVYWAAGAAVKKQRRTQGGPPLTVAVAVKAHGLAVTKEAVYWTDIANGTIHVVAK